MSVHERTGTLFNTKRLKSSCVANQIDVKKGKFYHEHPTLKKEKRNESWCIPSSKVLPPHFYHDIELQLEAPIIQLPFLTASCFSLYSWIQTAGYKIEFLLPSIINQTRIYHMKCWNCCITGFSKFSRIYR